MSKVVCRYYFPGKGVRMHEYIAGEDYWELADALEEACRVIELEGYKDTADRLREKLPTNRSTSPEEDK
jgi:hypothetical protein